MAQYSTYTCTTRFSYDRDDSDNNISKSFLYIEENHSLQGVVHNVPAELGLRITTNKATRTNMAFVLFKFDDSLIPKGWNNKTTCYKGSSMFEESEAFANLGPYILAKTDIFTATWAGTALIKTTFIPTDLGKNIANWNGRICLGVYQYGTGSHDCYWAWKKDINLHSFYTLEYTAESSLKDVPVAVQLGNNFSVSINSYDSSYTHKIKLSLKDNSREWTLNAGVTVANNLYFPKTWGNSFSSTITSAPGTIELFTYKDGKQIGSSNSKSITCSMTNYDYNGSNDITISSFSKIAHSTRFKNSIFSNYLVSGFNSFKLTVSFNPAANGATAKTISVTYNNQTQYVDNQTSGDFTFLANSNADKIVITVLDSRGATGTKTLSFPSAVITSYKYLTYYPPTYEKIEYYRRSDSDESAPKDDINGQYVTAKIINFKSSYTSPNTGYYNYINCSSPQLGDPLTDSRYSASTAIDKIFAFTTAVGLDQFYDVNITISDNTGYSYAVPKGTVNSSNYLLHFGSGQKSIGIGYAAKDLKSYLNGWHEKTGLLSIGYDVEAVKDVYLNRLSLTNPLSVSSGGTGVNSYEGLKEQLGINNNYLPLTGGTITGDLSVNYFTAKDVLMPEKLSTLRLTDYKSHIYTGIGECYDSSNYTSGLFIGCGGLGTGTFHHYGKTYLSAGYNEKGPFPSAYILCPQIGTDGYPTSNAIPYEILHSGNFYQTTGAVTINSTCYGYLSSKNTVYIFVVPIGNPLKNITKATLIRMYGHIRGGRGGYLVQDWNDSATDNNAVDFLSKTGSSSLEGTIDYVANRIQFRLACTSSLGGTNNSVYTFTPQTKSDGVAGLIIYFE